MTLVTNTKEKTSQKKKKKKRMSLGGSTYNVTKKI